MNTKNGLSVDLADFAMTIPPTVALEKTLFLISLSRKIGGLRPRLSQPF
jgi:hypothetical protein